MIDRTTSGSPPAVATISRMNSYQLTARWLVTCTTPACLRPASSRTTGTRSAVNVGQPRWSLTNASGAPASSIRSAVFTMLLPATPHTHELRTTVAVAAGGQFAGELRGTVDRDRIGGVVLTVGAVERAVEHVVGADVDEMGTARITGVTQPADGLGIVAKGPRRIGLAGVDGRPRRCVDHHLGSDRIDRSPDGVLVTDVELGAGQPGDVVALRHTVLDQVVPHLPAGAGDQHSHQASPARALSGSHQSR